ncbi:MAG TPA: carbon-nitrogen hydrolase family protein [Thermoplasmatales archaeon]|nr:carbon-nitrogen hydrolase family protein [Thermoplasmatales archaeon]
MKIALVAARPKIADKKTNIETMKKYINKEKADLYVFGELFLCGYRCKDELRDLAEPIDGSSIKEMKKIAAENNCYIIFGMPLKDENIKGLIKNAAVMVYPNGKVDVYKKWFLPTFGPFEEKIFFDEGEELKVFETRFGKIGVLICYDIYFPEIARAYTLQGADMLVCISASPSTTRKYFERLFPARAIENTVFVVYSNLVGTQEDLVFWGGSQLYTPLGELVAKTTLFKEEIKVVDVDFNELEQARAVRPVLRDLRPEIYHDLYELSRRHKS